MAAANLREGFLYKPGLIGSADGTVLPAHVRGMPFQEFESHGCTVKRRAVSVGLIHSRRDLRVNGRRWRRSSYLINGPAVFGVVAEAGGRVVGSDFLSEWDEVRSAGRVTVDPNFQARGMGGRLMEAVIERGRGADAGRLHPSVGYRRGRGVNRRGAGSNGAPNS